jgi:hypothetical protein
MACIGTLRDYLAGTAILSQQQVLELGGVLACDRADPPSAQATVEQAGLGTAKHTSRCMKSAYACDVEREALE